MKRFQGKLELFSVVNIVWSMGRGKGLPVLQEAVLVEPFMTIREDVKKTAYASYWAELIYYWLEEGNKQAGIYNLFEHTLTELDCGDFSEEVLSIFFQLRLAELAGLRPNLRECSICRKRFEMMDSWEVNLNLEQGGLVCNRCAAASSKSTPLSRGTIKQLLWIQERDPKTARRIRLTTQAIQEGLAFLEHFVPYHMGSEPRSLKFLRRIRSS